MTGGAGFIGSHLTRKILESGRNVRIIDNFYTGSRTNLVSLQKEHAESLEIVESDVRDLEALRRLLDGAETVYHQAAIPSVQESIDDPTATNEVNITGTLNTLVTAKDHAVKKVVIASSCAVYGDSPQLPKTEAMKPDPLSPYAVSKLSDELYVRVFSGVYEFPVLCLRYFNVFGPGQDPSSDYAAVIPKFITLMLRGNRPVIFGDGEQSRDFVFVENVVDANLLAAESSASGLALNIGSGRRMTLNQLVEELNSILGTRLEPVYKDARPGDIRDSESDISQAQKSIGYSPRIDLRSGLERTVEWFASRTVEVSGNAHESSR